MIDLHIHSTCSDGVLSPIEILQKCDELKLECISITDHDTCQAYNTLSQVDLKKYYSGKLITGCELRTSYNKIPIEILAYDVDYRVINQWREKYYSEKNVLKAKNKNLESFKENCRKIGMVFDPNIVVTNVKKSFVQEMYEDIIKYEINKKYLGIDEWVRLEVFLREYCANPESRLFVDRSDDYPSLDEIIEVIKAAGGLSFLAHPLVYAANASMEFATSIMSKYKLDGMECYYSSFSDGETKELLDYCNNNNLLISGGTDYHGTQSKSDISIGTGRGNLNIPYSIIEKWGRF